MDHPTIERIERTGYPPYSARRESYGIDALGNETYCEEEILVLDDDFFLVSELESQTIEALEAIGATYQIAK